MLVNGIWHQKWQPVQKQDQQGRFIRQSSQFRTRPDIHHLSFNGQTRYKLYAAYICPWATRTLIARELLQLEDVIDLSIVEPFLTDQGWRFGNYLHSTPQQQESVTHIHELYTQSDAHYTGRATVPVLWDRQLNTIINNESADIVRIFNNDFRPIHQSNLDLYPVKLQQAIDQFNASIYDALNNGVYRAGFASSAQAYHEAVEDIFKCLNKLELHFTQHEYALGTLLTESDIRLFVTLVRFDVAYVGLFKTNLKMIKDYPHLSSYLKRLLQIKAFANNTYIDHIKAGYYSIKALNPSQIVPAGPDLDWLPIVDKT